MQRIHIGIEDGGLRPDILKAAGKPGIPERSPANLDWWNLVKDPQRGERVILYLKKPVKAFVATCTVASGLIPCPDQTSEFKDKPCFLVSDLSLLPNGDVEFGRVLREFNDWPLAKILVQTSRCLSAENTTPAQLRRFLKVLGLDESFGAETLPEAVDLHEPPPRMQTTVSRIVRDSELSRRIKQMHEYRCQLCPENTDPLTLADGSLYAEGHHIRPLGSPHDGHDGIENILCLCPNHHALCDFGAIRLDLAQLRQVEGHNIGREFIDYHNTILYPGKRQVNL